MKIIKIISEWKRVPNPRGKHAIKKGFKRVEAIVEESGRSVTRHIDVEK